MSGVYDATVRRSASDRVDHRPGARNSSRRNRRSILLSTFSRVRASYQPIKKEETQLSARTPVYFFVACLFLASVSAADEGHTSEIESKPGTTVVHCTTGNTCSSGHVTMKGDGTHTFSLTCETHSCPSNENISRTFSHKSALSCIFWTCGYVNKVGYSDWQCTNWTVNKQWVDFTIKC